MWLQPEIQFAGLFAALSTVAIVWLLLVILAKRHWTSYLAVLGAFVAAGIVAAIWQAEAVLWLWQFPQALPPVWSLSMTAMTWGIISGWQTPRPWRWPCVICGVVGLSMSGWAALLFLWIATVSPGGV